MLKKSFIIVIVMLLTLGMCVNVNAAQTSLNIVEKESKTKYLDNNQGTMQNKILSCNSETGTITMQLSVTNTKQTYENTEIIVIMEENLANDTTKLNQYISQVNSLASKVFLFAPNLKIGIIGMKGTISDRQVDSNGKLVIGKNDQGSKNGSASDAEVLANLTNNAESLTQALKNMNAKKVTYNNNLQAALKLAKSSYSGKANKILITLFDNMPSTAIGVCKEVSEGKDSKALEQAVIAKNKDIVSKTKSEILSLEQEDINFILLKPGNTDFNQKWYSKTGELTYQLDGSTYAQQLYGTTGKPTYGEMYSLENSSLATVLITNMYEQFMQPKKKDMTSVVVTNYFPKEIMSHYKITIAQENVNNVDTKKYETDGSITWNIGTLAEGKTSTLQYTLQLTDMKNASLLNKTIATNEKTEITYKDADEKEHTVALTSSSTIQLKEEQEQKDNNNSQNTGSQPKQDNTTAKGMIPQTGVNIVMFVAIMISMLIIIALIYKKYHNCKDIK